MEIRRATHEDIPWIKSELADFASHIDTKHSYLPPTDELFDQELSAMIDGHVLLIACKGLQRVGLIGGVLLPHQFNNRLKTLVERFWWVSESHRGSRAGYFLIREFLKIGDAVADATVVSLEHDSPVLHRMMEKLGLKLRETIYAKES